MDFFNDLNSPVQLADLDGDGIADAFISAADTNANGVDDTIVTLADTNRDGVLDTVEILSDTDENGLIDRIEISEDITGDGLPDVTVAAEVIDADGDGVKDAAVIYADTDGDFAADEVQTLDMDERQFAAEIIGQDVYEQPDGGEPSNSFGCGYEQFDPDETDMSRVVGDPVADEAQWEYQGESGPCAVYAQAMAYQNVTGEEVDIEELIAAGTQEGWYTGSTTLEDMSKALNYLGVDADVRYRGDFLNLDEALSNGGRVVVAVDGDEIWYGDNDTFYSPNDPNHAVEVIGIDYSGDEPMVIINDSGTPDGHAIMVPKERFIDAWQDSDFAYVEVYA